MTQATAYQLSPDLAREGSGGGNSRITESGAYKGVITRAEHIVASTGTVGVEIDFECVTGSKANFITLYTKNSAGEAIWGLKQLNALMTCLSLRDIQPQQATIKKYDFTARQEVDSLVTIFPALMNKPVGLVLQKEQYLKQDNTVGEKLNLVAPFNAETNQVAVEILDKSQAEQLEKIVSSLKDKLLPTSGSATSYQQPTQTAGTVDFDDDIPF